MTPEILYEKAHLFIEKIRPELNSLNLPAHWDFDHICYRVETPAQYGNTQTVLQTIGALLAESQVNGRLISTFKLNKPLTYDSTRRIDLIELPMPKITGKSHQEGFEHLEIVCDESFTDLKKRLSHLTFSDSGLKKNFNQELEFQLSDFNIKFHHLSLESVIRLENNQPVFTALKESKILEILQAYSPLVVGTFPLELATPESDIDIIIQIDPRESENLKAALAHYHDVHFSVTDFTLSAQFEWNQVKFEVYGEIKPVFEQNGFLHFNIEERLLKYRTPEWRSALQALRNKGLKTEPAFAQLLNLSGDPFEALLKLQKQSTLPE